MNKPPCLAFCIQMKTTMFRSFAVILGCIACQLAFASIVSADIFSDVWTTGFESPSDGAFGSRGSVSGNTLSASITSGSEVANIELTSSHRNWFKLSDAESFGTNNQLVPFLENEEPFTNLKLSSDAPLRNVDLLLHNVWNATNTDVPGGERTNYIGNFRVTYANGTVVNNALPTRRLINENSPFETDFEGGTLQPSDLDDVFDAGDRLTVTDENFDPGNGANPGYYWYDMSKSFMSERQGFGILSFDESIGAITDIEFTWVGHTIGTNTAFLGFAAEVSAVPEPAAVSLILVASIGFCVRRRREYS